ncbi:MAG: DUF1801 domain-containing protein [Gracilimonas sp.]|nr:DUF1801 domain-containing protein [Gracilimonas sp.]
MQYEVSTPTEYFEKLEDDWRKEKLLKVRDLILKHGPELKERIEYKMLSYAYNDKSVFNLNAQRAYVSLYVGTIKKVNNAQTLLKDLDTGKGCIRIKKSVELKETGLEEFIRETINIWNKGGETDC